MPYAHLSDFSAIALINDAHQEQPGVAPSPTRGESYNGGIAISVCQTMQRLYETDRFTIMIIHRHCAVIQSAFENIISS